MRRLAKLVFILTLIAWASRASAEEAVLKDGRRLKGRLSLDRSGRLRFLPENAKEGLAWETIHDVRWPSATPLLLRARMPLQVLLENQQRLVGELRRLDQAELLMRTCWSKELAIPRALVRGIEHLPGWVPVYDDDFADGFKAWKVTGKPSLIKPKAMEKSQTLVLDGPGQGVEYSLPRPLGAGQMGINFQSRGKMDGTSWYIELTFENEKSPEKTRFQVASTSEHYEVSPLSFSGEDLKVRRTEGWHRLTVAFTDHSFSAAIDNDLIWYSREHGPAGPLLSVLLKCKGEGGKEAKAMGSVSFAEFALRKPLEAKKRPPGERDAQEVWLLSGDQIFGAGLQAHQRDVELTTRNKSRRFGWTDVRGIYPKQQKLEPRVTEGEHVRIWLHAGAGREPDELEGVLSALDDKHLQLVHSTLGTLRIEKAGLSRIRRLFHGRRIEVDNEPHTLGDPDTAAKAPLKRVEGRSLERKFRLEKASQTADLLVKVVQLQGSEDGIADGLKRGDLRTEVRLNGKTIDYLNRHVDRALSEPRVLRVKLPADLLRAGDNVLEFRQIPDRDSDKCVNCGILKVTVEVSQ